MDNDAQRKKVVLTCVQPTGKLHLGNYLGAVKNWIAYQEDCECYFGIVDMHAITIPYVPADLRKNVYSLAAQYMACGIDPTRCNMFVQSNIAGHADLAWILGCICPLGQLERMTQYKDKARKHANNLCSGLLYYPVLMAADILIYNADIVPVGEDQKQHIEITRDLAQKFNRTYSDTFVLPEAAIPKTGARIMSLQTPDSKMSKSDPNQNGTIYIIDDADTLRRKIMSAVTDSDTAVRYDVENKPGISNLMNIMSSLGGMSLSEIEDNFAGKNYGEFKKAVADVVVEALSPVREKYNALITDKDALNKVLADGACAAQRRADRIMSKVRRKVGFVDTRAK